ncbi:MAG: hypothetical protein CVU44_14440 [Chloroflexi bacterium HGW-Chloroflexi-6]|nr:MAG: hypothetical protein CVU44_14440 [Chloroflexi bacterium HGW-Chloroflexi-6]
MTEIRGCGYNSEMRLPSKHLHTCLRWIPAIFFASLIFMFSATPAKQVAKTYDQLNINVTQAVSPTNTQTPLFSKTIDWLKVGHVIGYFCLGAAVLFAHSSHSRGSVFSALMISSLYAISDEFHQNFIPGRSASSWDVLLDSLAALAGIVVLRLIIMKLRQRIMQESSE